MAETLYFQSFYFPTAVDAFYNFVFRTLNMNDEPTKEKLYNAFNVIEFDHKYHRLDERDLTFMVNYLNKFTKLTKTLMEYILFKIYSAILLCELKNYERSNEQSYAVIPYITDALERNSDPKMKNFYKFCELTNSMIVLKNEKQDPNHDIQEYLTLAISTFNQLKDLNIPLDLFLLIFLLILELLLYL